MTELSITSTNSNVAYAYTLGQAVVDEKQFLREAYSRVLVTCRSGFYPSMNGLTSDSGFGFRTRHIHPFSIQHIMEKGVEYNKEEGKWFELGTVANVYAELIKRFAPNPLRIGVYICEQGLNTIYIPDAIRLMKQLPDEPETFYEVGLKIPPCPECPICRPILILFPTRLGIKNIAEEYRKVVLRFFTIPQCIGILGGHPNQARYFFGSRNDNTIIFLDPHKKRTCQEILVPGMDIYAEEYMTANYDKYFACCGSGSDSDRVRSD
ncbi:MAG: hypothetical protein EZS28_021128 [Streblomastix strix]|uniref:Cysteine protease n=1 Tax=Streblomastix strix TaxID=222440 RepID=A0A5J4VLF9_9EUKA|nr:MAG: hypothetical protein EZS28_021128 [Streblomastix strix]